MRPPIPAETVEVSPVLPFAASPATRPPLPAVLSASFVSVPVARTVRSPVRVRCVTAPDPSWAGVVTAAFARPDPRRAACVRTPDQLQGTGGVVDDYRPAPQQSRQGLRIRRSEERRVGK